MTLAKQFRADSMFFTFSAIATVVFALAAASFATPLPKTAAVQNFASLNIGSSATATVTVTILSAGTLGGVAVNTQGAANQDFTDAGEGTCTVGTIYAVNATCTVKVTFTPKLSGTRYGAAVLSDNSQNVIATGFLQGTGLGPQINFPPGTESTIINGLNQPSGLVVDGNSNLYIADSNNGRVVKETWSAGSYTESTIFTGLNEPGGLAVDGAGNIYIGDAYNNRLLKETWSGGGYTETTISSDLNKPNGIAVDGSGNVYVADAYNGRVLMETLSAGTYTETDIYDCGSVGVQGCPSSVAVDGSGNIFITAYSGSQILELTPSAGGYTQNLIGSGLYWPSCVVTDGSGNLYIADTLNSRIVKETLSAGSYVQSIVSSSALNWPWAVAADGSGNIYISDSYNLRVLKENLSDTPSLTFATTGFGSTSSDSPKIVTVENVGNAALNFSAVSYPSDFPEANAATGDCTASTSLAAEGNCTLTIDFTPIASPTGPGTSFPLSENVVITTNTLNAAGTQQAIQVSGTETIPPAVTPVFSPAAGTFTSAQSVTITDTITGAAIYYTTNGTTPTASSTLYTGVIAVPATETIKAIAAATGYSVSAVASATFTINLPPTFSLAVSPASLTISPSQSGTITLRVTPQNGFASATTLSCTGLPAGVTCAFSPATVTPSGAAVSSTLTVSASSTAAALRHNVRPTFPGEFPAATLALALCCFGWRKRRHINMLVFAAALFGTSLLIGCGGSSTPKPMTSTVTVNATSGTIQQAATFSLTIQ